MFWFWNFIVCTWACGGSAIPGCQTLNGRKAWLVWLSLVTWDIYGTGIPQTKMTRPRRQKTALTFLRSSWAGLPSKHRKPTAADGRKNMFNRYIIISPHEVDEWLIDIRYYRLRSNQMWFRVTLFWMVESNRCMLDFVWYTPPSCSTINADIEIQKNTKSCQLNTKNIYSSIMRKWYIIIHLK